MLDEEIGDEAGNCPYKEEGKFPSSNIGEILWKRREQRIMDGNMERHAPLIKGKEEMLKLPPKGGGFDPPKVGQ